MKKIYLVMLVFIITPLFSNEHLSSDEKDSIKYMVESEKLSRDLYQKLYELWELEIFNDLYKIEITHNNAVKKLAELEELIEENSVDNPGEFKSAYFDRVFKDFSETSNKSFYDAIYVAATMEEMAIFDIMEYEATTGNETLAKMLLDLKYGAMSNLRKLNKEIQAFGVPYEGKYLDPALLKRILGQ